MRADSRLPGAVGVAPPELIACRSQRGVVNKAPPASRSRSVRGEVGTTRPRRCGARTQGSGGGGDVRRGRVQRGKVA